MNDAQHPAFERHLARDLSTGLFLDRVLAFETTSNAAAPAWIQVFPAGPELKTVDGRDFRITDPEALIAQYTAADARPIMVDYDHLSAFAPDEGGDQTAAGWIESLEVRDGQVWAKVAWTIRAADRIAAREYRFVSPEFTVEKKTGEIVSIDAVAIVNRPAFQMTALASRARTPTATGDDAMKSIAKKLGLPEDATEEQILAAIATRDTELASAQAATPSTRDFMPRADYDTVLARADAAEAELAKAKAAARADEIETVITAAVHAGKIAPASREHYAKLAAGSDEAFEEVKALCGAMTPQVAASGLDGKAAPGTGGPELDEKDREFCRDHGIAEADYAAQLAAERAA
ncbi:MAG: phage protease [Paracoccaceae bacterium]